MLVAGGRPAPPDGRAVMTAARLARLLATASAAAGRPRIDPVREAAALAGFRAARRRGTRGAVRPRSRTGLRWSAAVVGAALAVGSAAVAVASVRYLVPGDGAGSGSGPMSRPPAAVSPEAGTTGPVESAPVASAPAASRTAGPVTPAPEATRTPHPTASAQWDARRSGCRKEPPRRSHCAGRHGKGHARTHGRRHAGDTSVG